MEVGNEAEEPEEKQGRGPVKSAERTLRLLEYLSGSPSRQTLHAMHKALGIPKSSLHGIVWTLVERGWVEADESRSLFRVGVRALLVGTSYLDSDRVVSATHDAMDRLAAATTEAVQLARMDGTEVVYLASRRSIHELQMFSRVGRRIPAHAAALGKSILATRSNDEVIALMGETLPIRTRHTIDRLDRLIADLDDTRKRGYAVEHEENTLGIQAVALALPTGVPPTDSLGISIPLARANEHTEQQLVDLLSREIDGLTSRLTL